MRAALHAALDRGGRAAQHPAAAITSAAGQQAATAEQIKTNINKATAKELMKKQELEKELHADLFKQSISKAEIKENATIQDALFEVLKKDKKLIAKLKEIVS